MRASKIAVVVSEFNSRITERLLKSCLHTLFKHRFPKSRLLILRVPGAFEIPWAAKRLALSRKFKAVICLGAILRGETPQNTYIAQACALGLTRVAQDTGVPCIFGVLTVNTARQAWQRTRGKLDRGREAAEVALRLLERLGPTEAAG
ncbi:MAG: 6,7-dimethyl-8-ribityllumazine synthase [Elusimicrobia bacterium]|nr:6,7-dimethyl-8-ribityllumazine synthase [Elusimicrobiota bacterium]